MSKLQEKYNILLQKTMAELLTEDELIAEINAIKTNADGFPQIWYDELINGVFGGVQVGFYQSWFDEAFEEEAPDELAIANMKIKHLQKNEEQAQSFIMQLEHNIEQMQAIMATQQLQIQQLMNAQISMPNRIQFGGAFTS